MFKVLKFSCLFSFYSFSVTLLQIWLKKYPCKMLYTENSLRTKTFSRNILCYFKEINVDYSAYLKTSTTGSAKNRQTGQTGHVFCPERIFHASVTKGCGG